MANIRASVARPTWMLTAELPAMAVARSGEASSRGMASGSMPTPTMVMITPMTSGGNSDRRRGKSRASTVSKTPASRVIPNSAPTPKLVPARTEADAYAGPQIGGHSTPAPNAEVLMDCSRQPTPTAIMPMRIMASMSRTSLMKLASTAAMITHPAALMQTCCNPSSHTVATGGRSSTQ